MWWLRRKRSKNLGQLLTSCSMVQCLALSENWGFSPCEDLSPSLLWADRHLSLTSAAATRVWMREKAVMSPDCPSPAPPFSPDCYPGHWLAENAFCSVVKTPCMLLKDTAFLYHTCTVSSRNWFKNKQTNREKLLRGEFTKLFKWEGMKRSASCWLLFCNEGSHRVCSTEERQWWTEACVWAGRNKDLCVAAGWIWGETVSSKNLSFETEIP